MGAKIYRNALIPPMPLAGDFTPYCLRHTYCTDLCRAGVDIRTAQRLMGHANISITADIYTHVDVNEIMKAGELLNQYLKVKYFFVSLQYIVVYITKKGGTRVAFLMGNFGEFWGKFN